MYRFLLCLSLLLSAHIASANDFFITLKSEKITVANFPYRVADIMDAREQTYCIGMVQRGMTNKRTPAFLKEGLTTEFGYLFANSFANESVKKSLVLKINKLQIYEITYAKREVAIVELGITFFEKEGDALVEVHETGITLERSGLEVTRKHDENIAKAVEKCLLDLVERQQRGLTYRHPSGTPRTCPIVLDATPKPGIIRTFSDFRENTAREEAAHPYKLDIKENGKNSIVRAKPDWLKTKPEGDIWGISDGQHVYINLGSGFFRLTKEGGEFLLFGPSPKDNTGAVLLGSALGGLVGGLIAGAMSADYTNKEMTVYKIDLSTGAMVPFEEPVYRRIESRMVFFSSNFNPKDSRLSLSIDGQPIGDMAPSTYHRLRLPPPEKAVEVCISTAEGQKICETVTPELFKTTVVLLRLRKGKPIIDLPDNDTRSGLLQEIKSGVYKPLEEKK